MTCPQCSTANAEQARFCKNCGSVLEAAALQPPTLLPPVLPATPPRAIIPPAPMPVESEVPTTALHAVPMRFGSEQSPAVLGVARRQRRRRLLVVAGSVGLLAGAIVGGVIALGGSDDDRAATSDSSASTEATQATQESATTSPSVASDSTAPLAIQAGATTIAPVVPETTSPATLAPVTVAVPPELSSTPPATIPPLVTVPLVTTPPSTAPSTPTELTQDQAIATFQTYFELVASRVYPDAWSMLTPRYQAKYLGYDNFVRFWETVEGTDIREAASIVANPGAQTLHCKVSFGRRVDGTTSNEIVDVDFRRDPLTGSILIDDYRYLGNG
ncbi:MAG: hypothetical protein ABIR32_03070 [Ilumatobacteraceae bacterium]